MGGGTDRAEYPTDWVKIANVGDTRRTEYPTDWISNPNGDYSLGGVSYALEGYPAGAVSNGLGKYR